MILFPEPCVSLPILSTFLIEDGFQNVLSRLSPEIGKWFPPFAGSLKLALYISCDVVGPPNHQTGIPIWSTEVHSAEYPDVICKIPGENNVWLLPTSGH
jgi:hypothetical protein